MNMIEPGSQQTINAYTINSVTFKSILVLFALWLLESQQEIDINGERHSLLSESEPLVHTQIFNFYLGSRKVLHLFKLQNFP